jgi:molybdopterin molybdotransferase
VRAAASDFAAEAVLLEAGIRLSPLQMIAAAAADQAVLRVGGRPGVAIIATGDELVAPGSAHLGADSIPESVSFGVAAMAEAAGARILRQTIGCDDLAKLEALAGEALAQADWLIRCSPDQPARAAGEVVSALAFAQGC